MGLFPLNEVCCWSMRKRIFKCLASLLFWQLWFILIFIAQLGRHNGGQGIEWEGGSRHPSPKENGVGQKKWQFFTNKPTKTRQNQNFSSTKYWRRGGGPFLPSVLLMEHPGQRGLAGQSGLKLMRTMTLVVWMKKGWWKEAKMEGWRWDWPGHLLMKWRTNWCVSEVAFLSRKQSRGLRGFLSPRLFSPFYAKKCPKNSVCFSWKQGNWESFFKKRSPRWDGVGTFEKHKCQTYAAEMRPDSVFIVCPNHGSKGGSFLWNLILLDRVTGFNQERNLINLVQSFRMRGLKPEAVH